ncbi:hypothetical protein QTP88_002810 [Uroleucon formosanum]
MIKLKSVPNDIIIIQVYMPTTQVNDEEVEVIYEKIKEFISLTNSNENLIIMGDWNGIMDENTDCIEVGKCRLGTRNEKGERFVEFCRQHDLVITNTLFMNHKRRRYKYKMPGDINRYQLDYIMDKEGNLLIDEIAIANRWKEYVEEPCVEEVNIDLLVENLTDGDFNSNADTRILKSEFEDAFKTIKKNKVPGPDKLNTELLQQTEDEIKNAPYELLCQIYETGKIPRDFGCSRLIILSKKPRANKCEHFRTLSLISHATKLLAIILSKRISKRVEARLTNYQYGFRKNKGIREAILGLRVILAKQIERQKITCMAFADLEKAFDSINWTSLFKILEETEIDFKDRRIPYKIYEEQETIININTTTVTAKIQKGGRQGCPLSSALFNVFIEKSINVLKLCLEQKGIGVKIAEVLITMLRFADNIVVLATSEEDLQAVLNAMNVTFKEYSLKINAAKTKTLVCYKKNIPSINISLENKEITQVDYFKYLGSIITDDGKSIKEIRSRIGQAKNTFLKKRK